MRKFERMLSRKERPVGTARRSIKALTAALVWALCLAGQAQAGVGDSPLPVLNAGDQTRHAYSLTGVTSQGTLETVLVCTSLASGTIKVGLEVFDKSGGPTNDVAGGNGLITLAPGETGTIGTGLAAAWPAETTIAGLPTIYSGSARVVSTSLALFCTAFVSETQSNPPISMKTLNIIKGTRQDGD